MTGTNTANIPSANPPAELTGETRTLWYDLAQSRNSTELLAYLYRITPKIPWEQQGPFLGSLALFLWPIFQSSEQRSATLAELGNRVVTYSEDVRAGILAALDKKFQPSQLEPVEENPKAGRAPLTVYPKPIYKPKW